MQENTYLQNIQVKSNNQINYLAGGINTVYPPQNIQDDECQDMYNMCLDKYPAIRTRVGRTLKATPGLNGTPIKYFGVAGVRYLFYIQGESLKDMQGTVIATGITGDNFSHVYYADGNNEYLVLYGNGIVPTRHKLPLSALNTPDILPLPTNVTSFEHMCYHKNRMFGSVGNMLYFSALQNPMDWTTAENSREDRVPNCNQITGLVSFDDKLIVFSEENMHLYYGSNVIAGYSDSYTCVSLDNNIGCYDQCTIKVHNSYLYWLFGRSIYEYDGSTVRNIEKPTSNNGVSGGITDFLKGITLNEAKKVSVAASEDKIYFWFSSYTLQIIGIETNPNIDIIVSSSNNSSNSSINEIEITPNTRQCLLIFDQRLRKWTKEVQLYKLNEMYYSNICDAYTDLNFSQTPTPVYALTQNGMIYELTGGRRDGNEYIRTYGEDEYAGAGGLTQKEKIPFYFKTKEFKNGVLSKRKSLSEVWFNYDLDGTVNLTISTDTGKSVTKSNILPNGTNKTECVLIPNELHNVNSYTFEIYGEGDLTIYAMERVDRTHLR